MNRAVAIAEEFKQYAYSVSHDVSGPVRAMVEFSKILSEEEASHLSGESQEYLSLIVENGQKLQKMMDSLLQYSRLNTLPRVIERVDLNRVVQGVLLQLFASIEQNGTEIELGELPVVQADQNQMWQLFHALLENALIFHSPESPLQIHLHAHLNQERCEITVADNGIGVPPNQRESIFQLFKRLHSDEDYPGIGMGLTLAKKIVEGHNGTITCAANQPIGTVFTFTLPLAKEA